MTDRERLLAGLDGAASEFLLMLADEAEEAGQLNWAGGWRYLARNHLWPVRVWDAARDEEAEGEGWAWEWWGKREGRHYSCSLPRLLLQHVKKQNKTVKGATCSFATAGDALRCAAYCAGNLIALFGNDTFEE